MDNNWINDINKKLEEQRAKYQEALDNGDATKRKKSYASSCVSKETRVKAGKIAGKKNVESGHLENLRTKEHQSKAGTIGGLKRFKNLKDSNFFGSEDHKKISSKGGLVTGKMNVESGHWAKVLKSGTDASVKVRKEIKLERYSKVLTKISNDWITRKEIVDWFMQSSFIKEWNLTSHRFISGLLNDENYFETKGNRRNKKYRKKEHVC